MHFESRADAAKWLLQNQDGKRNLTAFQRTEAALKVEAMFKEQAKANKVASGKKHGGSKGSGEFSGT